MKEFHRSIFFTNVPLRSQYRYKDVFQIFPCNLDKMPRSKHQKHFPNILEFWTIPEEILPLPIEFAIFKEQAERFPAMIVKQDIILALLTAFTNHLFFHYNSIGTWAIPIQYDDPGEESEIWFSQWCLTFYHWPELPRQMKIDSFSSQQFPNITCVSAKDYYTHNPNLDFNISLEITFPNIIDSLFDSYFSLPTENRTIINTAANYNQTAVELIGTRKTVSLLSSFTAMETMVNLEFKDETPEKCPECNQLRFSISKKFREYLLKYIGNSAANKKKFNHYYSLRSKIVHTGKQLKTEHLFTDFPEEEKDEEYDLRLEILQIGRMAINKWLLHRAQIAA